MTSNLNQHDWRLDLSSDNTAWSQLLGITSMDPPGIIPTKKDSSTYDNAGWGSQSVTAYNFALNITALYSANAGVLTPGITLALGCVGKFRDQSMLYARWYRTDGVTPFEGWTGQAICEVTTGNTNWDDLRSAKIVLSGSGSATPLGALPVISQAPVVTAASPSNAATGAQVLISGAGFTGATAVKFGTVAATEYTVVSDQSIVAVVPAGAAGAANITVTNGAGTSAAFNYTRAA